MLKRTSRIFIFSGFVILTAGFLSLGFPRNGFAFKPAVEEQKKPEPAFSAFLKTVFFGAKLPPAEKSKNRFFVLSLLGAGLLGALLKVLGTEIQPPWGGLWEILYSACLFIYGFWILNLFCGLPWEWRFPVVAKGILAAALGASALTLIDHQTKVRRRLTPGYRKCPHCGEVIVLLSVECFSCHRKV